MGFTINKRNYVLEFSHGRERADRVQKSFWDVADLAVFFAEFEAEVGDVCDPPERRAVMISVMQELQVRYTCLECGKRNKRSECLSIHMRTHTGDRPYRCTECTLCFVQAGALASHMRRHTGHRPYACTQCDSAFTQSTALKAHIRRHENRRPYKCDECEASFVEAGDLAKHKRRHAGLRPLKCEECGRACFDASALGIHKRVHSGHRPYKCPDCNAMFTQAGHLLKHSYLHSGERPHRCIHVDAITCEPCVYASTSKSALKAHIHAMHSPEGLLRKKKREESLAKALTKAGIPFKREHRIDFDCLGETFCRIDFLIEAHGCLLFVEVDEEQHAERMLSCELRRMTSAHSALALEGNSLSILFIRFNPDGFSRDGERLPGREYLISHRQKKLIEVIRSYCDPAGGAAALLPNSLNIQYMYFNHTVGPDGSIIPDVFADVDFDPVMKPLCLPMIVTV